MHARAVHNYHPCAGRAPSPLTEELMHLCKTRIGKKEQQKERLPSSRDSAPIVMFMSCSKESVRSRTSQL